MNRHCAFAATTTLLLVAGGSAAAADPPAAPISLSSLLAADGIVVSGYLDAAYEHQSGAGEFSSGVPDRVFDARADSFALHQAALTIAKQPQEGFGAVVNLTAGQDAEVIKSYPLQGGANFDLTQGFVQYAHGPLTLMLGKFVTLAGAEVIASPGNSNFSRSILFGYAIPFTHTGLRATYAIDDRWTLVLGVDNGWDQVSDANRQKTIEYGVTFTPAKSVTLLVDGYVGREPLAIVNNAPSAAQGQRFLVDVVATWNATAKLTLVLNYDDASQKDDSPGAVLHTYRWDGVAAYGNYQFTDRWRVSLRGEYFDDRNGYRTGVVDPSSGRGQRWKETTLTVGYAPAKSFELRLEGRYDESSVPGAFVKSLDGTGQPLTFARSLDSVAIEALYKF
ncbi:MAG: porin [Gammaproteobacteria bacterium]|nr:porin [Gammaproteobacteria bacterium]